MSSELKALAEMSGIEPEKFEAALADPSKLFEYLDLDELQALKASCERLGTLQARMVAAMEIYAAYGRGVLDTLAKSEAKDELDAETT